MPLVKGEQHFKFERFQGIHFWMRDGANDILCNVTYEALRDRCVRDGENASLPDTFVRHRQRIETIAAEKYAKGHRKNELILIFSADLTPLPM